MRKPLPILALALLLTVILGACTTSTEQQLQDAERMVLSAPDSAMTALRSMGVLDDKEQEAVRCLLYVWAEYRNYEKQIPEAELNTAFDYFHDSHNYLRKAQVYYLRSAVNDDQKRGDEKQNVEDMFTAAKAIEKTDDHILAAQIYQRCAAIMNGRKDIDEGELWSKRYLDEARKSGSKGEEVIALINLSQSQFYKGSEKGDLSEAINTLHQALKISNEHHQTKNIGRVSSSLSTYYSHIQKLDSALFYALKAKDIQEQLKREGKMHEEVRYWTVADAYRKMGNADSALYYARKAYTNSDIKARMNATMVMYLVYGDLLHDYERSNHWMQIHNHQQDSLRQIQQKGDAVIAMEKVDKQEVVDKLSMTRNIMWHILAACALVIALIIIYMRVTRARMSKQMKQLQDELNSRIQQQKEQELQRKQAAAAKTPEPTAVAQPTTAASEATTTADSATETPAASENSADTVEAAPAQPAPPTIITLAGSTKESLTVTTDNLLIVESEGNYLNATYLSEGQTRQKMLRMTMKQAEEALASVPEIQRCHRAFIVNTRHIAHVAASTNGLMLKIDHASTQVPVSRTYVENIREAVARDK